MMEVEQKFIITSETRHRLSALGAHRATTRNVLDVYYDTPQNMLMRDDHWLRKRNGNWELKYRLTPSAVVAEGRGEVGREGVRLSKQRDYHSRGDETELERAKSNKPSQLPSSLSPPQTQQTDQYIEEEDTVNILAHLEKVFQLLTRSVITDAVQSSPMATVTMDTLLECGPLVPIVEIEFVRECYIIKENSGDSGDSRKVGDRGGCEGDSGGKWEEVKVDLDKCTYAGRGGGEGREYGVGEVEIMVASSDEAEGAAQRCRELAQQLGKCRSYHNHPHQL